MTLGQIGASSLPESLTHEPLTINHPRAYWPETFLLGPYQATLNVALSDQGPIFKRTIYFFALPLQAFIGIIVVVILIVIIKNRIKSRLRED